MTIEPCNEPRGEGTGWEDCTDNAPGCQFFVFDEDDFIASFGTRQEAEIFINQKENQ